MNILYLASVRIPTEKASGLAIMRQCEAFASLGHNVTLLRPSRKDSLPEDAFSYYGIAPQFSIISFSVFPLFLWLGTIGYILMRLTLLWKVTWFVWHKRKEIDVLYARDPWLHFIPLLFFPKEKMISEMHTKHSNWVTKSVVSRARKCVVISEGLRTFYTALTSRTDISVEPSGVDLEQFKNLPSVTQVRRELMLPQEKVIFSYIGKYTTMGEEKGVLMLVQAFASLYAEHNDTFLLLVGLEQHEREVVLEEARIVGLPKEVVTVLPLDTKLFARYVQASDVLLMNYPDTEHYRDYMSPSKLLAYRASGKIVLTSSLPSILPYISKTESVVFAPGQEAALVEGYKKAYRKAGSKEVTGSTETFEKYSWKQRGERILQSH